MGSPHLPGQVRCKMGPLPVVALAHCPTVTDHHASTGYHIVVVTNMPPLPGQRIVELENSINPQGGTEQQQTKATKGPKETFSILENLQTIKKVSIQQHVSNKKVLKTADLLCQMYLMFDAEGTARLKLHQNWWCVLIAVAPFFITAPLSSW
eukprot:TRINITY_DN67052_c1_g3_i1.p1 TRINITY_DN67052_c1_g3~~TRINITY_DN67052_c1_g3_i1.p1  ORF type:complete len:152 (-),score=2.36 TRINITY_DN67052_c1_g3_i1:99-554(-)